MYRELTSIQVKFLVYELYLANKTDCDSETTYWCLESDPAGNETDVGILVVWIWLVNKPLSNSENCSPGLTCCPLRLKRKGGE